MSPFKRWLCLLAPVSLIYGVTIAPPDQGYERNVGQYGAGVLFGLRDLLLYQDKVQIQSGVTLQFVGANPNATVTVQNPLPYPMNVYMGSPSTWRENVTTFGTVVYSQIYPGIDTRWNIGQLRIVVAPGADAQQLLMRFSPTLPNAVFSSLTAYQSSGGSNSPVAVRFVRPDQNSLQLILGVSDAALPLAIEIGTSFGAVFQVGYGLISVGDDGSVLLAGYANPPVPADVYFLAKLHSDGTPAFLTLFDGADPFWLESGSLGDITLAGFIPYNGLPAPVTGDAPQPILSAGWMGRFGPGGTLRAATYTDSAPPPALGPDGSVYFSTSTSVTKWVPGRASFAFSVPIAGIQRLATDAAGNLVFAASQKPGEPTRPTTPGAVKTRWDGWWDGYAGKLNPVSGALLMATYVPITGASPAETGGLWGNRALALAPDGNIWIASEMVNGGRTLVVLNSDGSRIMDSESISLLPWIAFDAQGNGLLVETGAPNLPTSLDAPLRAPCQFPAIYLSKKAPDGSVLSATYLSGSGDVVAFNGLDELYVISSLSGPGPLFPQVPKPDLTQVNTHPPASPGIACVINPASRQDMIVQAPGELVTIAGNQLGPIQETRATLDAKGNLPLQLAGVQVTVDNVAAPLVSVQQGLITFYLLPDTSPDPQAVLKVLSPGNPPSSATIQIDRISRFEVLTADGSGSGLAAALNQDGTVNSFSTPAQVGSIVSIFGIGATAPARVTLGKPAQVLYSGPAPGLAPSVRQINLRVPDLASGQGQLVVADPGSAVSPQPPWVYLWVSR